MTVYHVCFIFICVKDKTKGKGIFKKSSVVRSIQTPSPQSAELDKEKDDQEEMECSEESESSAAISINIQNSFSGGRRVIDPLMQRLEGIAECGSSPHATIDESTVPALQDTAEKVWVV